MSDANATIIADHVAGAPLAKLLGIAVESVAPDVVVLRLPFREAVTTLGDLIHGGAISGLIDVAATAAAWTGAQIERGPRGTTVGLTVNFLAAARGEDLRATARIIQRGRSMVVCEVSVAGASSEVARALVTYKLDHATKAA
ncbi:MAG: PaaI family thioesterase [bacterium]